MNDFPSRVKCTKYMVDKNITHLQSQLQQSGLIPHNSTSISNRGEIMDNCIKISACNARYLLGSYASKKHKTIEQKTPAAIAIK